MPLTMFVYFIRSNYGLLVHMGEQEGVTNSKPSSQWTEVGNMHKSKINVTNRRCYIQELTITWYKTV
jgi:hypothetical protein